MAFVTTFSANAPRSCRRAHRCLLSRPLTASRRRGAASLRMQEEEGNETASPRDEGESITEQAAQAAEVASTRRGERDENKSFLDPDTLADDLFGPASASFLMTDIKPLPVPEDVVYADNVDESRSMFYTNKRLEARNKFKKNEKDCGSAEFQSAQLTIRIEQITAHLREHPKDNASRRGLQQLVERRKTLFRYMYKDDPARVERVVKELGIRFNIDNLVLKNRYGAS